MRLIDADALSDWMKDYGQKCIKGERKISLMYVWKHIQDMQTIEERETGEWLPDNTNYIEERYICSNCKRSHKVDTCMGKPMWDFCPSCGKRMLGGGRNVNADA